MRNILFLVVLVSAFTTSSFGQGLDMIIRQNAKKVDIPFEYENNFIIINLIFNDAFPLKFIFDTGAEHTILTKREITDLLQVNYQRSFTIFGADMQTELTAYLAQGVRLQLGNLYARNRTILVLDEDYFKFEEFTGIDVQGILGADFFRRFIVRINYRKRVITLYDPVHFKEPTEKFTKIPIEVHRHKPYVRATTKLTNQSPIDVKLLIDSEIL